MFEIANEVENVFAQTFETMECTSAVEFGWLKNKFIDKPQDKKGKTKALKYEEMNIEEIKNKVFTDCSEKINETVNTYLTEQMVLDN